MAKFHGVIGYAIQTETAPGVWRDTITERMYFGDIIRNQQRWTGTENVNDDMDIDNSISIIADPFALNNLGYMKYVKWMGIKWKIKSLSINRPRVILQLGGVYNDQP